MNESGQLTSGGSDRFVEVVLGVNDEEGEVETVRFMPELFQVDVPDPSAISIKNGRATVRVKILECSMNDSTRNFFIEARKSESASEDIDPARTSRIVVINHQLQLAHTECKWEDEWYKDEGGRDKAMTFNIELRNAEGALVQRKVPLKIRLVYANGHHVERQDILKLMGDELISGGRAEIRARIDEVYNLLSFVFVMISS